MMRSMYSSVTGLRTHQTRMDVIGNNIANVNTVGFKKSRVTFADKLYQSIRGGSAPTAARGGTNPMGIGLGVGLNSIDQIHTPSAASASGRITDLTIDGNGYFLLRDTSGANVYTRAGVFDWDEYGNLVNPEGLFVQGWLADPRTGAITASSDTYTNINIAGFQMSAPRATTWMELRGNAASDLNTNYGPAGTPPVNTVFDPDIHVPASDLESQISFSQKIFDSLGNEQMVYYRMFKAATNAGTGAYQWVLDVSLGDPTFGGGTVPPVTTPPPAAIDPDPANPIELDATGYRRIIGITFDGSGKISSDSNFYIHIDADPALHNEDIDFNVDLSLLTQYKNNQAADDATNRITTEQDGHVAGDLVSLTVGGDGIISGTYNNGDLVKIGRVALANFQNPGGLIQVGNTLFKQSMNSGEPLIGVAGSQGFGALLPSYLEMSNVDLAEEFTDMIVTQRGFQANSRIITTSDEMLQELVNLKR